MNLMNLMMMMNYLVQKYDRRRYHRYSGKNAIELVFLYRLPRVVE